MQQTERRAAGCCSGMRLAVSLLRRLFLKALVFQTALDRACTRSYYRDVAGERRTQQQLEQQVESMGGEKFPALCDQLNEEYGVHPASLLIQ